MTAKATRNANEAQKSAWGGKIAAILRQDGLQPDKVKGAGLGVKPNNRYQQQRGGQKGIDEKLDGRFGSAIAAEHGDEDRHGHQRQLPEGVVEEHIERDKDADHRRLLQQEEEIKLLGAVSDGVPGSEHAERREKAGQHHQPERDAIHSQVIANGRAGDPGAVDFKLKARVAIDVMGRQMEGQPKGDQRHHQGEPLDDAASARKQCHDHGSCGRHEGRKRQYRIVQHRSSLALVLRGAWKSRNK